MVEAGRGGSVINISSASSGPPLSKAFTYGVAKAGVNQITQFLAREWAPHNVRDNEPSGFILTAILGIVGAFVATFLGQALGWYGPDQGAGLIGAVVGAIIVLVVYGMVAGGRTRAV